MLACLVVLSLIPPIQGSEEAQRIVDAYREKLSAAKSVSGTMMSTMRFGATTQEQKTVFQFQKPNLYAVKGAYEVLSDGTTAFMYMANEKQYMKLPSAGTDMLGTLALGFEPFFGMKPRFEISKLAMGSFKGQPAAEILYKLPNSSANLSMYVGKDSLLPIGYLVKTGENTSSTSYVDVKLDEPIAAEVFKWTPPEGATEFEQAAQTDDYEKSLLKIGAKAPDFTIKNTKGADVNLTRSLKGSKGMLVNFWFYG
jgi:outer membrane lipoprotein-sorting protein